MISCLECRHRRANLLDDADALMAENAAGPASRDVALEDVQVGAANCCFGDLDDCVGGRRDFRFGAVFQGLLSRPLINERFHRPCRCTRNTYCWFWRRHEKSWPVTLQMSLLMVSAIAAGRLTRQTPAASGREFRNPAIKAKIHDSLCMSALERRLDAATAANALALQWFHWLHVPQAYQFKASSVSAMP